MSNWLIIFFFIVNTPPIFTFLKLEKKKMVNEKGLKKRLIKRIISKEDWKIFSKMEDIVYQKDVEKFLYGFSKNKVYQIRRKEPVNLYFPIKNLELMKGKKDFYLLLIGEKKFSLLTKNLDIIYYKEFDKKIEKYFLEDRNFDGEDELYLIFKDKIGCFLGQEGRFWKLKDNLINLKWFVNDKNLFFLVFSDSIIVIEKEAISKKILPKKNEKFILCAPKKEGLTIISVVENRSILAYDKNNKIEIFGYFDSVSGKILKEGYLIKADNNLFFINKALTYYEKINEFYSIKKIKDYRIFDLNDDGKKELIISDGNYSYYFLNNSLILEERQRDYYLKLINQIRNKNLYNYQDLLITILNLSVKVNLPFEEISKKIEKMIKQYYVAKIQQKLLLSSFLSVFFVLFIVLVVRPIFYKVKNKKWQIENRFLLQICKIAKNLIALNHNYLIKGNFLGAQNMIKKIIDDFKLVEEEIFYLKTTLEPKFFMENYFALLRKILNNKNIINLIELIEEIDRSFSKKIKFLKIKNFEIKEYLRKDGYYFLEVYDPFMGEENLNYKIFLDDKLTNFLNYVIIDHFRYAQKRAIISLEKKIITNWQKKIILYFYSDAETGIDFEKGHLAKKIKELKENYFDYLTITPGSKPQEKLILIFSDLVGIIEGIIEKIKI